jgi:tripartite-type tricarboxylate transporter receptor subunit TctC
MQSQLAFLTRARFAVAVIGSLAIGASCVVAQEFPHKPIQLIVPFAAGGAADIIGRTIGDKLSQIYGQQVVASINFGAV